MSEPEIRVVDIDTSSDDFLILASDGLFDRFSSQECVEVTREKLQAMPVLEQDAQKVAQELVDMAKKKRMMTDNITVILIALNSGIQPTSSGANNESSSTGQ